MAAYKTRQWMEDYRKARGLTIAEMSIRACCTEFLLTQIEEEGWKTTPNIAARIAREYGATVEQYNEMVLLKYQVTELPEPKPLPTERDYMDFIYRVKRETRSWED